MPTIDVNFTQFLRPNGHRAATGITLDDPDGTLATDVELILAQGVAFETEVLRIGDLVSLTITDPIDGDLFHEIVPNGPKVPIAVTAMIRRAAEAARNGEWPSPEDDEE